MGIQLQLEPGALGAIVPMIILSAFAFLVLLWDTLLKPESKLSLLVISLLGLSAASAVSLYQWQQVGDSTTLLFSGRLSLDRFSVFFNLLFLVVGGLVFLISREFLEREQIDVGEYYALGLFSLVGMMVIAMSADLIMIFIGIEVMSISIYTLAAFNRSNYRCIEGALKYFILGSFATGFLLYGIALLYGATGTTNLAGIREHLSHPLGGDMLAPIGIGMLLVGFGFKVAAAPFHMWAPDVYEGASTPVTAIMAAGVKAAAFAAIIRTFVALAPAQGFQQVLIWGMAALTIVVGNIAAIRQTNLKRMLAYSSIAHSGYMLGGLLAVQGSASVSEDGMSSLLFYLAAYVLMNLGAFGIIVMIGRREDEPETMEDWAGIGFKYPWLGAAMTVFMLSLGGMPPTAGFFAKFYLFSAILDAGHPYLVILAVLTSAASFYYYLRVVVYMYMYPSKERWTPAFSGLSKLTVALAIVGTLWLGIAPSGPLSFLQWARASVHALL